MTDPIDDLDFELLVEAFNRRDLDLFLEQIGDLKILKKAIKAINELDNIGFEITCHDMPWDGGGIELQVTFGKQGYSRRLENGMTRCMAFSSSYTWNINWIKEYRDKPYF